MKLEIDPTLSIPLHLQVEKLLREYIQQEIGEEQEMPSEPVNGKKKEPGKKKGSLKVEKSRRVVDPANRTEPGKMMSYRKRAGKGSPPRMFPKEVDLANELGVARNTVRQAISKLVNEGLLIRKRGVGTIVCDKKIYTSLDNWYSFTREMKEKGLNVINYKLDLKKVVVDSEVSQVFNLKQNTPLLCLSRLRGTEKQPYLLSISWFHPRFKINENEDFSMPLYDLLAEKYGIYVSTSREEIGAIAADERLADKLQIKKGDPVLFRRRSVFNSDGIIVEYNKVYYRGDGISYSLEIRR